MASDERLGNQTPSNRSLTLRLWDGALALFRLVMAIFAVVCFLKQAYDNAPMIKRWVLATMLLLGICCVAEPPVDPKPKDARLIPEVVSFDLTVSLRGNLAFDHSLRLRIGRFVHEFPANVDSPKPARFLLPGGEHELILTMRIQQAAGAFVEKVQTFQLVLVDHAHYAVRVDHDGRPFLERRRVEGVVHPVLK